MYYSFFPCGGILYDNDISSIILGNRVYLIKIYDYNRKNEYINLNFCIFFFYFYIFALGLFFTLHSPSFAQVLIS